MEDGDGGAGIVRLQELIGTQKPRTCQECPGGTDIEGLREIEEFNSGSIYATNEHRNLHMNSLENAGAQRGLSAYLLFQSKMWENNFPPSETLVLSN